MTRTNSIPPWNDLASATWFVLIVFMILLHRHLSQSAPVLLDIPSDRSHPKWKSFKNVCQTSDRIRTTRV